MSGASIVRFVEDRERDQDRPAAPARDGWVDVCAVDDIPVPGARVVRRAGAVDIALFRTAREKVFALADRCPHKGGPLSQGIVYGERVACPLHGWHIELERGEAVAPDVGCAASFAVRVDGGRVFLQAAELRKP